MVNKRLSELLEFAQTTDLEEILWEKKDTSIHFRRNHSALPKPVPVEAPPVAAEVTAAPPEPLYIRSTMVGTFYRADSPDRPPLVVEGTKVTAGQPVAAVETMRIMKDVLSPTACRIVKALVANGHSVDYGQPLFEIAPETENV